MRTALAVCTNISLQRPTQWYNINTMDETLIFGMLFAFALGVGIGLFLRGVLM